jgi:hypothetical protein
MINNWTAFGNAFVVTSLHVKLLFFFFSGKARNAARAVEI